MSELTKRSGIPMTPKEQKEYDELFKRMADGSYDDKVRSNNEEK